MTYWAPAPQKREQMILFPKRLDETVPPDHPVRLLDVILGQLNWAKWESWYHGRLGQPPIHPRVLAGVLLYGLLTRIRSSRSLEDALQVRLDFRWLAEGRTIDHTTLSEFRRKHGAELKDLFVQIGLVARELGFLPLTTLAFDGTRVRANNRRRGTRTLAELRKMQKELAAKFEELEAKAAAEDTREDEVFAAAEPRAAAKELGDLKRRQEQVAAALAELERAEQAGETLPKRVPLTDPQSRVTPNKEGGVPPRRRAKVLLVSPGTIAGVCENDQRGSPRRASFPRSLPSRSASLRRLPVAGAMPARQGEATTNLTRPA